MENRRSLVPLAITGLVLALALPLPAAAAEAEVSIHPNPAHPGDIAVLVVQGSWSHSCVPRLYAMWIEQKVFSPTDPPGLFVALVAGHPDEGCLAIGTSYRLDIPLPFRAEDFPSGLHVFVSVATGEDAPSSGNLGHVFLDARSQPREELPLHDGLFEVSVDWTDTQGRQGTGKVVPGFAESSGLFWFFRPSNWELLVKVLNGCELNGHYWVLGAAATNVGYTVRVDAPNVGPPGRNSWSHVNPVGQHSRFFVDIEAIPCAFPGGGN